MEPPLVWFKLLKPESRWSRVSLKDVECVDDLKGAILKKTLLNNTYFTGQLTISATNKADDVNQATELDERKTLSDVLNDFNVPGDSNCRESFGKNIYIFVDILETSGKFHFQMQEICSNK